MQKVNFVQSYIDQSSIKLSIRGSKGDVTLSYPKHFLTYPDALDRNDPDGGQVSVCGLRDRRA